MDRDPHLMVFGLALLLLLIVIACCLYFNFFPKYSVVRLGALLIMIVSGACIPIAQIYIYRQMTGVNPLEDLIVFSIIIAESIISIALIFYSAAKYRLLLRSRP